LELQDHLHHWEIVLKILKSHNLYAGLSKCSFAVKEINYLGYVISGAGVAMENDKVEVIHSDHNPIQ